MRYEQTIEIAAPATQVWRVVAEVDRWPQWTPTMTSVEPLDPLPLHVGMRARVKQPGLRPALLTVASIEEGHAFRWGSQQPGLTFVADHVVTPTAEGAQVRLSVEFRGRLAPLVSALYGGKVRSYVSTEATSLKAHCEGMPRD